MNETMIQILADVISTVLITLLGVLGAYLTAKLNRRAELANIRKAKDELIVAARQTVLELQQTMVAALKEKAADGKLTEEEKKELNMLLLSRTKRKMSQPAIALLEAAAVDVNALIRGAGEALILRLHE